MIYSFQVYTGFQWTGYFAGEIRNVRRTATTSILGALLISAIGYVVAVALIYKYYGFNFFGAAVFMGLGGGSAHWTAAVPALPARRWSTSCRAAVAAGLHRPVLRGWPSCGGRRPGSCSAHGTCSPGPSTGSRRRSSRTVSDRFHTPVIATITVGCIVELLNYLNIYQGLGAYLLNMIAVMALAFIIVSISAAVTPWRRPQLHAQGPGWARRQAGRRCR